MNTQSLDLGLFGFGCVGQGLHAVLNETPSLTAQVRHIVVKHRHKQRSLPADRFGYDADALLNDPHVNTVVEMIDHADEAYHLVRAALLNGKAVVTANKKMLAQHLSELVALQQRTGAPLLYEASVGGSIPIIRNLEEYYDNDLLSSVEGILNGTCNYILSRMFHEGAAFEDVLRSAQEQGFAESDPSLDIDAYDPKYKISILTAHAHGSLVAPEDVLNLGIRHVSAHDLQFAREKGWKLQLVATSQRVGHELAVFVLPRFVAPGHLLHGIDAEYNGIVVQAAFAQQQFFVGKGAGSYPTASAVLADLSALRYGYRYEYKKLQQGQALPLATGLPLRVFLRPAPGHELPPQLPLQVEEQYSSAAYHYVVGLMNLNDLQRLQPLLHQQGVLVALVPDQPRHLPTVAARAEAALTA